MSAMAARTEVSDSPPATASVTPVQAQRRTDRRAELRLARRSRQRWAIVACSILVGAFGFTVGILDVLH